MAGRPQSVWTVPWLTMGIVFPVPALGAGQMGKMLVVAAPPSVQPAADRRAPVLVQQGVQAEDPVKNYYLYQLR